MPFCRWLKGQPEHGCPFSVAEVREEVKKGKETPSSLAGSCKSNVGITVSRRFQYWVQGRGDLGGCVWSQP